MTTLKTIVLAVDPLDPDKWETHYTYDVCEFLTSKFNKWPDSARIYHNIVSKTTDITPNSEYDIKTLQSLDGIFIVVVYPEGQQFIVGAIVGLLFGTQLLASAPSAVNRNTNAQSPNNELSERTNKPRPNARIPDIYGTVRSTPDLIAVPYREYVDHSEVEIAYMCIGRGEFQVSDIRDDTTLISNIAGSSVEVYGPSTSPNSGSPQQSIGNAINRPVVSVTKSNSVNGQVLRPPNEENLVGENNIRFSNPNVIETNDEDIDFTEFFAAGDSLTITDADEGAVSESRDVTPSASGYIEFATAAATPEPQYEVGETIQLTGAVYVEEDVDGFYETSYDLNGIYLISNVQVFGSGPYTQRVTLNNPNEVNPDWDNVTGNISKVIGIKLTTSETEYNLDGTYAILTVSDDTITLDSPSSVNSDWTTISETPYISPTLEVSGDKWVGPFTLDGEQVWANFIALNGLYKDNGKNKKRFDVEVELEITPVDTDGSPIGAAETFQNTIEGSATLRSTRAVTTKANPTFSGLCQVRARRITSTDLDFNGTVVDEIKWKDLYAVENVNETHFGNITTVQTLTFATTGALTIKDRKLNMLVTRKLPKYLGDSEFSSETFPTRKASDILSSICLDPYIGNRQTSEVDFDNIYNILSEVTFYFGFDESGEFSYTFDSDNLSFEEIINTVAQAIFCIAYRQGSIIKIKFESKNDNSSILFNHRNKIPGSETRSLRFGNSDNYDGVELKYVSPLDDAFVTYYIPNDKSAINPNKIETIGIRNDNQAYIHAWRAWNKIQYQNTKVEFTSTDEAQLLTRNDRILVSDNTRPNIQDGEVLEQNVLLLTLSQNVSVTNHTIFLQLYDETIEAIPVIMGPKTNQVLLAYAPSLPLSLSDLNFAKTTYMLVENSDLGQNAFLVEEISRDGNQTFIVNAINYDTRYYDNDEDFK